MLKFLLNRSIRMRRFLCGGLFWFAFFHGSFLVDAQNAPINFVNNHGFERWDAAPMAMPSMWHKLRADNASEYKVSASQKHVLSGRKALLIENLVPTHVQVVQNVSVEGEGQVYEFSAKVFVEGFSGGDGAYISLLNFPVKSEQAVAAQGTWIDLSVLFAPQIPKDKYGEVGLCLNLGSPGAGTQGRVYFDEVALRPINVLDILQTNKIHTIVLKNLINKSDMIKNQVMPGIEPPIENAGWNRFLNLAIMFGVMVLVNVIVIWFERRKR